MTNQVKSYVTLNSSAPDPGLQMSGSELFLNDLPQHRRWEGQLLTAALL